MTKFKKGMPQLSWVSTLWREEEGGGDGGDEKPDTERLPMQVSNLECKISQVR